METPTDLLAAKVDDEFRRLLGGAGATSNTAWADQPPFTLDGITALMKGLPPAETFVSSIMFPNDRAVVAKGERENITAAGPVFWARFRYEERRQTGATDTSGLRGASILEIDPFDGDEPETALWRERERTRILGLFAVAMQTSKKPAPTE